MSYQICFAPDGIHWQTIITNRNCQRAWTTFTHDSDIRQQIAVNPYARFRLLLDDKVLAELPIPEIT